jgi:sugar lactone lactonase YvrE
MYVTGSSSDSVHQYSLSTAWDISSATFTRSFDVSAKETTPTGVTFNSDGSEMYVTGAISDSVHQYSLSTAWDISSATFTRSFDVNEKEPTPTGVTFSSDGSEMYVIGSSSDSVHQYSLSTAWDISSATFTRSFSVSGKETIPTGVTFSSDGSEMYVIGASSDSVHQYSLNSSNLDKIAISKSFAIDSKNSEDTAYTNVKFTITGTELDELTYYIGEYDNSSITYTEVPTSGSSTNRTGSLNLSNTNKYGINWKVENTGGTTATITKIIINYDMA